MAWCLSRSDVGWAVVDRAFTVSSGPSTFRSPSTFDFGAGQIEPPCGVVGALELSVDEAVDGLVADDLVARLAGEAPCDLFG